MNLIQKLAYNPITKALQAVLAGGSKSITMPSEYLEGSWTPGIFDATSGGNEASYTARGGYFVKVGRMVLIHGWMDLSSIAGMTGANDAVLRGLPFVFKNAAGNYDAPLAAYATGVTFSGYLAWVPGANSTRCILKPVTSGGGSTAITVTNLGTGYTTINGCYITEE